MKLALIGILHVNLNLRNRVSLRSNVSNLNFKSNELQPLGRGYLNIIMNVNMCV